MWFRDKKPEAAENEKAKLPKVSFLQDAADLLVKLLLITSVCDGWHYVLGFVVVKLTSVKF